MDKRLEKTETEKLTLSIEETAVILGVGRNAAYAAAKRGDFPTIKIGNLIRVPKAGLMRKLEGQA